MNPKRYEVHFVAKRYDGSLYQKFLFVNAVDEEHLRYKAMNEFLMFSSLPNTESFKIQSYREI